MGMCFGNGYKTLNGKTDRTKIMKQKLTRLVSGARAAMLGGALIVALTSLAVGRFVNAADAPKITPVSLSVSETPLKRDGAFTTSFAPVIKRVAASVVKVNISTKSKTVPAPESPMDGDLFRRFFGDQFGNQFGGGNRAGTMRVPREHGLGSGVVVD